MYANVVTARQRAPYSNPPEAAAIATHSGPGFLGRRTIIAGFGALGGIDVSANFQ
jgi:hypothetical protein